MFSRSHLLREVGECYFEMDTLISVSSLEVYSDFFCSYRRALLCLSLWHVKDGSFRLKVGRPEH